jgi:hypothetical protein
MVSRARFPVTSIRDPMEVLRQDRLIAARVHELTPHVSARSSTVVADKAERVAHTRGLLAVRSASLRTSRKESGRHSRLPREGRGRGASQARLDCKELKILPRASATERRMDELDAVAVLNPVCVEVFTINEAPVHFHDHSGVVFPGHFQEIPNGQFGPLDIFHKTVECYFHRRFQPQYRQVRDLRDRFTVALEGADGAPASFASGIMG